MSVVCGFAAIAMIPWEWSFIDDGALIGHLRANIAASGEWRGIVTTIVSAAHWDLTSWGLFRPSYWLYQGVFYLLPVGPAHAVRVAMLATAVAGPVVELVRRTGGGRWLRLGAAVWCAAAVLANGSLWAGVWYPSLQELSGAAFLGLGLLAGLRRPGWLVACWTVAAWFKSPLAWVLLAFGLLLLMRTPPEAPRSRARIAGLAAATLGLLTLAAAALLARSGSYVTGYLGQGPRKLAENVAELGSAAGAAAIVVLVGVVLLGATARRFDALSLALLAGGVGYAATLVPWRVGGYYPGPAVYLVTVGAVLLFSPSRDLPRLRLVAAVLTVTLVAALFLVAPVGDGVRSVVNTVELRNCLRRLPATAVVGFDAGEGAIRLEQIVKEHDPAWDGIVARVEPGQTPGWRRGKRVIGLGWYIRTGHRQIAPALDGPVVCSSVLATVHRVP